MSNKYLITITISGETAEREMAKGEIMTEDDKIDESENESILHFLGAEPPIFRLKEISQKFPSLKFELWYRDEYLDRDGVIVLIQDGEIKEEKVDKQLKPKK